MNKKIIYPWLTNEAIWFLEWYLSQNYVTHVLEFGSGNSTLFFDQEKFSLQIITIENDGLYYNKIKDKLSLRVDFRWLSRPYYNVCDRFQDEYFNLILIDGRDRAKCIEKSMRTLKKGGILMLDNSERYYYQEAIKLLSDWKVTITQQKDNPLCEHNYPDWETSWWEKP